MASGACSAASDASRRRRRRRSERTQPRLRPPRRDHEAALEDWRTRVEAARSSHALAAQEIEEHNESVREFEREYQGGSEEAVAEYFSIVLESSEYPDSFPKEFRIAYVPASKQLVVEYLLPTLEAVPAVSEYSYLKTKDEVREKARTKTDTKRLFNHAITATVLRTLSEVFSADTADVVTACVINGIVDTVDPATGQHVRPCLVSVRATRDQMQEIVLDRVDPAACLKGLGAAVARKPEELTAVRPVVEFTMADSRFVAESDVLSDLETRPNIMDLNPYEFEHLVTNVFDGMGLEAKLTRSSKDGGVDCIAFDARPVVGGKVVIQAKRWKNRVSVSAVRDLYGTMVNEGANKGILVTTSGYGPGAFEFAKDKPIELIDGAGLLYLLSEQGTEARIVMPVDDIDES